MPDQDKNKLVDEQRAKQAQFEKAVRQMEKHVKKNPDGTFELKVKSAQEANVDPEAFEQLRRSLEEGNKQIKSGKVRANEVRQNLDQQ